MADGTTRREFLVRSGAASVTPAMVVQSRSRLALVGTGQRGLTAWAQPLIRECKDAVDIAALCDINRKRAETARQYLNVAVPTFVDFDEMVKATRPDTIVVATPDAVHWRHIVRGMELGCQVITEKALCTDEEQCRAILEARKKFNGKITVAHNARHTADARKIKTLLMEGAIGEVVSVVYNEYLNTDHGASYFRRWHRLREMNGTLLVTKACHHFDKVNWWLQSHPVEVSGAGRLAFYGKNNSLRSTHCRVCPRQKACAFYWDIRKVPFLYKLYAECESEDGYHRDGCVWREDTNIYDTSSVLVKYENGVTLTHTCQAFLPYEGEAITLNGTKGRLDFTNYSGGGYRNQELRLTRLFGNSEQIELNQEGAGAHRGADASLRELLFRNRPVEDPLKLRASLEEGAVAALVGIAAYRSIERGGQVVRIRDLDAIT